MRDAAELMLPAHLAWLRQAAQSEDTGCGARAALRLRRAMQRQAAPQAEPLQPKAAPDKAGP
jgi:hypothetical protein